MWQLSNIEELNLMVINNMHNFEILHDPAINVGILHFSGFDE